MGAVNKKLQPLNGEPEKEGPRIIGAEAYEGNDSSEENFDKQVAAGRYEMVGFEVSKYYHYTSRMPAIMLKIQLTGGVEAVGILSLPSAIALFDAGKEQVFQSLEFAVQAESLFNQGVKGRANVKAYMDMLEDNREPVFLRVFRPELYKEKYGNETPQILIARS